MGQHWLKDNDTLEAICQAANLSKEDFVLEIGPGLGDLTRHLVKLAGQVLAVELDGELVAHLNDHLKEGNLEVIQADILKLDLTNLPTDYKVVANIPYYLTSNLIRVLSEAPNSPSLMVLLVQKEVAERLAAEPGQMSLLTVSAQLYYSAMLGPEVSAKLFQPPPKVDSQVIILKHRPKPLFKNLDTKAFFRMVKSGFAGRRKKLRSSLAAGLSIDKTQADSLLKAAGVSGELRAQNLSLQDWHKLYITYQNMSV
jgi:16S rRNA (adenine1518-N6/adenine1519-N6)-dimethyltransferase